MDNIRAHFCRIKVNILALFRKIFRVNPQFWVKSDEFRIHLHTKQEIHFISDFIKKNNNNKNKQ